MDPRIADYIRSSRGRYTREGITQQVQHAGYGREATEATWEQLAADASSV